jgi:hypothetical protein
MRAASLCAILNVLVQRGAILKTPAGYALAPSS